MFMLSSSISISKDNLAVQYIMLQMAMYKPAHELK